jgi:hypothetical protein
MRALIAGLSVLIFLVLLPEVAFSQPAGGGPATPTVPLTGIEILLCAGALFGAKKLHDLRKKR